jgi:hypothetical protein
MITCLPELPPGLPPESSAGTSAEPPPDPGVKVMNDEVAKIIELLKA